MGLRHTQGKGQGLGECSHAAVDRMIVLYEIGLLLFSQGSLVWFPESSEIVGLVCCDDLWVHM